MQLRRIKNVAPSKQQLSRTTAACWSPNNKRLAVVDSNRVVHLYDENCEWKDKFQTRPADGKAKIYAVRAMVFSPDSIKLAIAQSDGVVFVLRLNLEWHDQKAICNKLPVNAAVTCMVWPSARPNEIVFGVQDGKVRVGVLNANKSQTLYGAESYVMCLASSVDGNSILSGHVDGSIYRYNFEEGGRPTKIIAHPVIPSCIAWGESISVAGSDCKIVFYDKMGSQLQHFAYALEEEKEFTCMTTNPTGHSLVVGSWNKFRNYNFNAKLKRWEEGDVKLCPNAYSITAFAWKPDGSRLVVCNSTGSVEVFDACIRRYRHKNKFEFTYISPSQVIVKRLSNGTRLVLKSQLAHEILRVNVHQDQFLIAHTDSTLLMGDMRTCKLSEVPWASNGSLREKFFFDSPQVCMVYMAGELALVEYGRNEFLGTCRTEHINRHLLSVRISDNGNPEETDESKRKKTIAYLIDRQTIRILDLVSGIHLGTVHHQSKIDWLELNKRATKLLFRDKQRCLFLYDIQTQERKTLLNYCSYVQWVPDADVVVAQNRGDLCVWYSVDSPDKVTVVQIKGQVEDIERIPAANGQPSRTEVIVDDGNGNALGYTLDESLIEFGAATESGNFEKAVTLLEAIQIAPETEALWQSLSQLALDKEKYMIAERCFAALGDVAKARALACINDMAENYPQGYEHHEVQANIKMLHKQFKAAEACLLDHGKVEEAMQMWEDMNKLEEVIKVAESKNHPDAENLKQKYLQHLLQTGQEEKAAEMKEKENKYIEAIDLYLKSGMPARAAHVVNSHNVQVQSNLLEAIASALSKAGLYEKAGDFFERLGMFERAIDAYKKGHCFRRAVELSRRVFPGYVVSLEEAWGDWLVSQKQVDAAINHFIEASQPIKAIEAAINSRQWAKAIQIVEQSLETNDPITRKFYKLIANHFEDQRQLAEAEKYYIKAGMRQEAMEMYTRNGQIDTAFHLGKNHMSEQELTALYINQAQQLEIQGKYKEAEKLFLKVNEPDLAIHMYKKARQYDHMIRLVSTYRKPLLIRTHETLANQLEREGNFKQAEYHHVQARQFTNAIRMYQDNGMWDDAIRCAKLHGGANASRAVVFKQASTLGGEQGPKLLMKYGLVEQAIDYAIENGAFEEAIHLANTSLKSKLSYVYLKHAMYLEDEARFKEAEEEFVKAGKPKEAVDMYIHLHNWTDAMRVAESYDPSSVTDIWVAQARVAFEKREYAQAEQYLLKASRPELLVKIYQEAKMWVEARRIAKDYAPNKLQDVNQKYAEWLQGNTQDKPMEVGKLWEESGEFSKAIETYCKLTFDGRSNEQELVQCWNRAVELAVNHCKEELDNVLNTVSVKLIQINRYMEAAKLYEQLGMWEGAVDVYIEGRDWEKAKTLADKLGPHIVERVKNAQKSSLLQSGDPQSLYESGSKREAFELWAKGSNWGELMPKVRKEAKEKPSEFLNVLTWYSSLFVNSLCDKNQFNEAAQIVLQDGMGKGSHEPRIVPTYLKFVKGLVRAPPTEVDLFTIRNMMMQLLDDMNHLRDALQDDLEDMKQYCRIVHQYALAAQCKKGGLQEIAAKLIISLVRYANKIPADKAFFDAGIASREVGWKGTSFVFTNSALDLHDEDPSEFDPKELACTDIPAIDCREYKPVMPNEKMEDARGWILSVSVEKTFDKRLQITQCPKCNADMWEGSAHCVACAQTFQTCIITGFPILREDVDLVNCRACKSPANREDWNTYILKYKTCPWCSNQQHAM